jgi:hypothetical protein
MNDLDDLLDRIQTPHVDVNDDVARGERALRHRRRWQVAAAGVSVVALVGAGVALSGHDADSKNAGFSDQPGATRTLTQAAKPHHASKAERQHRAAKRDARAARRSLMGMGDMGAVNGYHDVLVQRLDPDGTLLATASNEQGGSHMLGSKFDWNHGGMLEIVVGRSWAAAGSFYLLENAGMTPTTYDGHPARVSTTGDDTVVSVQHDDGTVVTLIASTSFGNNGTSTAHTDLTQHELLAAAADPRLTLPGQG